MFAVAGWHPTHVLEAPEDLRPALRELAAHPKVVAIGETGLDYYRLGTRTHADMHWQRDRFRTHIRAARQLQKPLVIHTRSASDDTLTILREEGEDGTAGSTGGFSIALPRVKRWPDKPWIWVFTSRFPAF